MGAVQVLRKEAVRQRNQIEHTKTERALLQRIRHPFLVDLKCGPVVSGLPVEYCAYVGSLSTCLPAHFAQGDVRRAFECAVMCAE